MKLKRRDCKKEILHLLGQEHEPITLAALIDKLESSYTSRTIRRLLNELIQEGLLQKIGHTRGAKYITVKRKSHTPDNLTSNKLINSCFGTKSVQAIQKISKPLFERHPVAYNTDWLKSYTPNKTFYLSENLRSKLHKAGERASQQDPAGTYAHQIFNRLLIDLSYNSSRLEGNTYSLLETERLLIHGDSPEGKLDEEKVMILNHKEAIRYLVDNALRIQINRNTICTLHYLLADGLIESRYTGKVRDFGVRISGSTYIPFENPKHLLLQLDQITEKAAIISDPFEQSLFLLIHVSYLQAFADVNKRTARLTANIPLITTNLVPLAFRDVEVQDYMSAMIAIYELQDISPIMDLYVYSYLRTCRAYDSTVKAMEFDEVRVRYRQERRRAIREIILSQLIGTHLQEFIQSEAIKNIPKQAQNSFIEDIFEDLEQIDESRLAGLGITIEEVTNWLRLKSEYKP